MHIHLIKSGLYFIRDADVSVCVRVRVGVRVRVLVRARAPACASGCVPACSCVRTCARAPPCIVLSTERILLRETTNSVLH